MKLLIYCYEYPPIGGGAGNALAHLANLWARQGHEVTIVTSRHGSLPADTTQNNLRIIRLEVGRRSVSRGRVREMLRYMVRSRATCEAVHDQVRPDLVVAFITLPSGVAPAHLRSRYGVPLVTELRGGDVPGFWPDHLNGFHLLTKPWIRSIWNASSLVIANSRGLAELAARTSPHIHFKTIPNGVDTQVFKPLSQKSTEDPKKRCRCVFVGRIVDGQKRIRHLIEVVARQPLLELVIVGAGPDEARLQKLAASGPGADRIAFKGWLKNDELLRTLRTSDVYVSASAWEGMSNSALEALSCGLPLVLSRASGNEELVEEGKNGFLFDPGSVRELEDRLTVLASDPAKRRQFGSASRDRAVRHFDWESIAEQHLDLYRQALST